MNARVIAAGLALATLGCDDSAGPSNPNGPSASGTAAIRLVFVGPTARRPDLPTSVQGCVAGVGAT
ncbi:MAG TPA: hypothetical protein VK886_23930, partial [Vicinamibacterales bacterium]|nr:hypothetical protein [Vicinamibacterales bacterium]